jgi:hypothetical protein
MNIWNQLSRRWAISSADLWRLLRTASNILVIASFLFNNFLAYSSLSIKCLIYFCKSSLNFSISKILINILSISLLSTLCWLDKLLFSFIKVYLARYLCSTSVSRFLKFFYWFFNRFDNYLFLFIPL